MRCFPAFSVLPATASLVFFLTASAAAAQSLSAGEASVTLPGGPWQVAADGQSAERRIGPDNWLRASIRFHPWTGGVATDTIARRLAAHKAMMEEAGYAEALFEDYDTDVAGRWCHAFQALSSGAPEAGAPLPKDVVGALCPLGSGAVVEMVVEDFTRNGAEEYDNLNIDAAALYDSLTIR
ncbi:hypothetical protein C4N9_09675 [Pararhodobacter marinus]|uniref:Uncharacterized protein n=1 Tax=Pararhodobacter marinus TaxID=2184063 RepID=A0A2U2CBB8_9RHOB|nr:hypothetical protein [Pararhodobacter marinus]PWE29074.1 hypothetical protein C4N9_09675 [Pararhodobacter marinus]